ncbi:MAG: pseudouridine synthase [Terriglobia bacterium]
MERLQKLISQAGICSRRKAEELILAGRVTVNGRVETRLGTKADLAVDSIRVDEQPLRISSRKTYLLLNKPKGYLCTLSDPQGRPTILDLLPKGIHRLFPVGRLDFMSEGLLLLSDDGDFAQTIMSAGLHCPKTYLVKVRGNPPEEALSGLRRGISLESKRLSPCQVEVVKPGENPWFKVTLIEGKNNQIRRMFESINHSVVKLKRIQIGFLRDPKLKVGSFRALEADEVRRFKSLKPE